MHFLLGLLGAMLVLGVVVDVLRATLGLGSGSLSDRLGRVFSRLVVHGKDGRGSQSWVLVQGGLFIMLATILVWIALLWTGWTLLYCSAETALVNAQTKAPATFTERVYFAGYTLFTLGLGDFQPQGDFYRLLTSVAALSGLFIVTFSITYLVPVLQAAVERRQLAQQISALGTTPQDLLQTVWSPERGFDLFEDHLLTLAPALGLQAQRHLAYPVLHYFHGRERTEALAPSVAVLDEALSLIEHGLETHLPAAAFVPARTVVAELLQTLDSHYLDAADEAPPHPSLAALRRAGLPVRDEDAFHQGIAREHERRALLLALVQDEGWRWEDVCPADPDSPTTDTKTC